MYFKNIYENGLAHASYIVGCQKSETAIVIDPKRDIETYIEIAEQEKLDITHIVETHIHADFLSGSRELAEATGAEILLSDEGPQEWQYQFDHTGLKNGDEFQVGHLKFNVLHTPGHTPEHISLLLTDTQTADEPVMVFTGDFVFVGDVGRPDLLEKAAGMTGTQRAGAEQMFESLQKFARLPDFIQVWPAHGAGSACGKALGAVPSSTVGYEKKFNWAFGTMDKNEFIELLLDGQPEPPRYFAMMKKLNKQGPDVLGGLPHPARLTLNQFKKAIQQEVAIVDTRDKFAFAGGHIKNSINIQANKSFSTWAGWVLDYEKPFILIADDDKINDLTRRLLRIGLDKIHGYMADIQAWSNAEHELETVDQATIEQVDREKPQILDVRGWNEFVQGHIPGAINIHAGYLENESQKLPNNQKIVVHCVSGDRSSFAIGILKRLGINNVSNLTGGISAWEYAGKPLQKGAA